MEQGWWFFGRLGRGPEGFVTGNNKHLTKTSVAIKRGRDKPPLWVEVVLWGDMGTRFMDSVGKGSLCFFSGKLDVQEWEKDGIKHTKIACDVYNFRVVEGWKDSLKTALKEKEEIEVPKSDFDFDNKPKQDASDDDLPF